MYSNQDITVCVPFYRIDNIRFLHALIPSLRQEYADIQVIISDNGSPVSEQRLLQDSLGAGVQFLLHSQNIGRAANRNSFLSLVQTPWMLFLDCDSLPVRPDFIQTYLQALTGASVICGGTAYSEIYEQGEELRWFFGRSREVISVEERNQNPYHSFMTNNFLIATEVFRKFHFDERLKSYGHEDTLFGLLLEKQRIPIQHIENRVYHTGLEPSALFIEKIKKSIENLVKISQWESDSIDVSKISKLWSLYQGLEKKYLSGILRVLAPISLPILEKQLCSKHPSLRLLDIYKLLYLATVVNKT